MILASPAPSGLSYSRRGNPVPCSRSRFIPILRGSATLLPEPSAMIRHVRWGVSGISSMLQYLTPTASRAAASSTVSVAKPRHHCAAPTHLIVMANGLWGNPANWDVICEHLSEQLDMSQVVLHASKVNTFFMTYEGIDMCGQRLADEILSVVSAHGGSLRRISVIGHSMGGLLARYAIGALYDPHTHTIAGLVPCHFLTIATPHLGCDQDGVAQVPLIGWIGRGGASVQNVLKGITTPAAGMLLRRTGKQFFRADADGGSAALPYIRRTAPSPDKPPVAAVVASAQASPTAASLLASPDTPLTVANLAAGVGPSQRTMHSAASTSSDPDSTANNGGSQHGSSGQHGRSQLGSGKDYFVVSQHDGSPAVRGSGSASRGPSEQRIASSTGEVQLRPSSSGTSRTSSSSSASSPRVPPASEPLLLTMTRDQPAKGLFFFSALRSFASRTAYANSGGDHLVGWANSSLRFLHELPFGPEDHPGACGVVHADDLMAAFETPGPDGRTPTAPGTCVGGHDRDVDTVMLRTLQSLSWRRIDVSFKGAWMGFAHNNIQVTRRMMNFAGLSVTQHLANTVAALDATYLARTQGDRPARGGVDAHGMGATTEAMLSSGIASC